ncbi:uncharacterized protein [Embiotoca jacksoni]|uniref:uncharacterized protein isoform X2 n=1 Tax=Embiotoca jacksoni TaxID=100190 RepID=UPI0037041F20
MMERRRALTIPFAVENNNLVSWTAFTGCKLRHRNSQHKNGSVMFDHNPAAMITLEMTRRKPLLILTDVLKTEQGKAYVERMKKSHTMSSRGQTASTRRESSRCRDEPPTCRDTRSSQRETGNKRSESVTPKRTLRSAPSSTQRSRVTRRLLGADNEDDNDDIKEVIIGKGSEEDDKFAEVVDCGLSVSWEPSEDTESCDEFSPPSIKDTWTDPEKDVQHSLKRKRKVSVSQCNGTGSPKRHCERVLRLTGEDGSDGELSPASICQEDNEEDGDVESLERSIVQFTVGGDMTDVLVPVITPNLEVGDFMDSPRLSLSSSQDNTTITSPAEPIVLSSDDEEGGVSQRCSQVLCTLVTLGDAVIKGQSSQEGVAKQQQAPDIQDLQVLQAAVAEVPRPLPAPPIPSLDYAYMGVPFFTFHCGSVEGKANGGIMIVEQNVIIPLKDTSERLNVVLTFERKELRRYSVWEQQELEEREVCFKSDRDPPPTAALLLCVSDSAAAAIHQDLCELCVEQDGAINAGEASPFILLTLRDPLEGMEGALLRSFLDIDCLSSLTHEQIMLTTHDVNTASILDHTHVLSLDESIELIRRSGLDSHLLSILGVTIDDPELNTPEEDCDGDKNPTATVHVEMDLQEELLEPEPVPEAESSESSEAEASEAEASEAEASEAVLVSEAALASEAEAESEVESAPESEAELEAEPESEADPESEVESEPESEAAPELESAPESEAEAGSEVGSAPGSVSQKDTKVELTPKEEQKEKEVEPPSEKKKEEPAAVYTLCHYRTKGSYSALLCKPNSKWTKYKHQGLPRRLIQFPPPPLKGGITVTMEDLQCLDNGQFLNDVIIDFYLKYVLQNASAAVAERSHIFSSFFYKQLTRRDNAREGNNSESCQRQRRHQRVKTWTRHVDIFKKDFLFVPVNQEAHWYLVVICFPGLDEPKMEDWTSPNVQKGKNPGGAGETRGQDVPQRCKSSNDNAETPPTLQRSDNVDTETGNAKEEPTKEPPPGPVNCTELTCQKKTVCKRPCILIMDSLKLSLHERVFKLLREYLQSEWEVRRGSSRDFGPDQMTSSHCKVPLQDNTSDCGLYLLQYVECFLKDPVVHFDLPLQLDRWFPRQQVRRKRDDIRDLILNLYRHQNLDNRRMKQLSR